MGKISSGKKAAPAAKKTAAPKRKAGKAAPVPKVNGVQKDRPAAATVKAKAGFKK